MGRILAFDYGIKRTGVAVSDPLQMIANSLETVQTINILDFIREYCLREPVDAFVVGYPFSHGHAENDIAKEIDRFILQLNNLYPNKQVHKVDEGFTSAIAARTLLMSGVNKKERRNKGNVDAISANLILQSYLEMKK